MVKTRFLARKNGVSKKTEKEFFMIQLLAQTIDDKSVVVEQFVDKAIYDLFDGAKVMTLFNVDFGVDEYGRAVISDAIAVTD